MYKMNFFYQRRYLIIMMFSKYLGTKILTGNEHHVDKVLPGGGGGVGSLGGGSGDGDSLNLNRFKWVKRSLHALKQAKHRNYVHCRL